MKVNVDENIYIESDEKQFVIVEYTGSVDKDGNERTKTHGYFGTLEHCLKHLVTMKIKKTTARTLSELVEEMKRIRIDIESQIYI